MGDDKFCDNYTIDGSRLPLPKDVQMTLDQEHDRTMLVFDSPCICPNPLLTDVWLPWARDAKYIHQGVGLMTTAQFSEGLTRRQQAVADFSWAIPCHDALQMITDWASKQEGRPRIVEIGSGTGYWASLLQAYGASVVAVDTGQERTGNKFPHFPSTVQGCGLEYLKSHDGCGDQALFLCWPRDATEILEAYRGNTLIWIGEMDGCTWDLRDVEGWEPRQEFNIPTWPGIHDFIIVYVRKESMG